MELGGWEARGWVWFDLGLRFSCHENRGVYPSISFMGKDCAWSVGNARHLRQSRPAHTLVTRIGLVAKNPLGARGVDAVQVSSQSNHRQAVYRYVKESLGGV
jgi:hypothetical protein